jgi:vacuolar-type H+-ATPase subunit I/STV1
MMMAAPPADSRFHPSMQLQPSSAPLAVTSQLQASGGSFEAMTSFLNEQQDKFVSLLREERETSERRSDCQRHDMETKLDQQRHDMETKLDEQRRETQQVRHEMETERDEQRQETCKQQVREVASAMSCVSEAQMELLQTRLDALHQAKLLSDDEIGALEDCIADYIDCRSSLSPAAAEIGVAAEKVKKMVGLSEGMGKDGMLARQLRRKLGAGQ